MKTSGEAKDPARPETYPRRVLVAVTGGSPQVVTETLYALAVDTKVPFVPTEMHLLTTGIGAEIALSKLLQAPQGQFHALCAEYGLTGRIAFDGSNVHVFRNRAGVVLDDIRTVDEVRVAANHISRFVRDMTSDPDCAVHASIAGGRKTSGYYLGYALSLFGRDQDRLSHVLVSEPFESSVPTFFYKPKKPVMLPVGRDPSKKISTGKARITLADVPFVRLRDGLPPRELAQGKIEFMDVVSAAQKGRGPMRAVLNPQHKLLICGTAVVQLTPEQFALYALFARKRMNLSATEAKAKADRSLLRQFFEEYRHVVDGFTYDEVIARNAWAFRDDRPKQNYLTEWQNKVHRLRSNINKKIRLALGTSAAPYSIESDRGYGDTAYYLKLDATQIVVDRAREVVG